jgi:hypothetical protein
MSARRVSGGDEIVRVRQAAARQMAAAPAKAKRYAEYMKEPAILRTL